MKKRDVVAGAQRELARRKLAREELLTFAWYTFPNHGYLPGAVHFYLASVLEQVERYVTTGGREGIGRLMVFMPPRHGKSEQVSVRFPAWFLGRNPGMRVLLTSCTGDLATSFSRQVRDTIRGEAYGNLWGRTSGRAPEAWVEISQDSRSASAWDLANHRGGLVAAGVGGSIIGRGAHLAIIDDPFKDREDAESQAVRDRVDDWYKSTLYTRLEDGGAIVLMHQRWHADDLAGRLIKRMVTEPGADHWVIISLAALAEDWAGGVDAEKAARAAKDGWWMAEDPLGRAPGAPLWPEKFPRDVLDRIKINVGGYEWSALYAQRPQKLEGALINGYEIIQVTPDQTPEMTKEVRYWDLAVSGKARADWVVGARLGRVADGRVYIRHVERLRGPWSDARPKIRDRMLRDPASVVQGMEVSGQQGGYYQEMKRDPALSLRSIEPVNPRDVGNKVVRAQVWASRIQDKLIYLVNDGSWDVDALVEECVQFPNGAHDDQVDGVSGGVQMLGGWSGGLADVPQSTGGASMWERLGMEAFSLQEVGPWQVG